MIKLNFNKYLREKINKSAFKFLIIGNARKRDKSYYILSTKNLQLSFFKSQYKIYLGIFGTRSTTLELKTLKAWKYENNLYGKCGKSSETMDHFVTCVAYGREIEYSLNDILEDDKEQKKCIARSVYGIVNESKKLIENKRATQPLTLPPSLQRGLPRHCINLHHGINDDDEANRAMIR